MSLRKVFEASDGRGCSTEFIALLLFVVFLLIIFSPRQELPETEGASAGAAQTTPSTATSVPPPGVLSFGCEPGIAVGQTANVNYVSVRMRHSPGYVNKDDSVDSKSFMTTGDTVMVKGGPEIKDGLCWWFIEHEGQQGWTADHSHEGKRLLLAGP